MYSSRVYNISNRSTLTTHLSSSSFLRMLCMASMILSATSLVAFLAIVAASSPEFISETPVSILLPLEAGQALKRRHLKPEYRDLLLLKAVDPLGHFWQGLHAQGSGILSDSQSHFILFILPQLFRFLRSHVPLLTWGASRGSSSSSEDSLLPLPLPLPLPPLSLLYSLLSWTFISLLKSKE